MAGTLNKILVVDDDRFAQKVIVKAISPHYEVRTVDDGLHAMEVALDWLPDTILLDVEMPHKNGYEVCEEFKANPLTAPIPIIFLSGTDSLRAKMLGFERGADDYLVKPFDADLLRAKVKVAVSGYHERLALDKKAQASQDAAFEALTTSAELGRALRFVEHTFAIPSFNALAQALFQSLKEFGLNTSVMFVTTKGPLFYSHLGLEVPPLEQDLLQLMHQQGRFSDFGCRTFCNFRQVALLIKNMPLADRERYGRIKDTVPFILGSVDGKIRALDIHESLVAQGESLAFSVSSIGNTLTSLTEKVLTGHNAITGVMRTLMSDLDSRLPKLGLEEDQERYLVERIDSAFTEALAELDRSLQLGNSLAGVVRLLAHMQNQQRKMVETTQIEPESTATDLPTDGASLSSDFEMF
jgi:DNA-binding response OmpR family regulator